MERSHDASREEAPSAGRRRFVRVLGLGGLFAGFAGTLTSLVARDAAAQASPPPATPPPADTSPPGPSDEAKALHAILVGRYGAHLDDVQKEALLPALEGTVQSGKALRAVKLANSVEPDFIFRAVPPKRDGAGEPRR
jgi:hypothetical protein